MQVQFEKGMTNGVLFLVMIATLGFSSCMDNCVEGKGEVVKASKEVDDFTELKLNVSADVTIIIGDEHMVEIEAQGNIIQALHADVKGETLVLKASPCVSTDEIFRIRITTAKLTDITINGSGSVVASELLEANKMKVSINGSGDTRLNVSAEEIKAGINGSGDIILKGSVTDLQVKINGSGDFKGSELISGNATVRINGSGDVVVHATEELSIDVYGSGDVKYSGNPKVKSSVKGSGEVSQIN